MKINVILPSLGKGGAEKVHVALANKWADLGHKVTIYTIHSSSQDSENYTINSDITLISLSSKRLRNSLLKLRKTFNKERPNVTFVAMWPLSVIAIISWILSGKIGKLFVVEHTSFNLENAKQIMRTSLWKISLTMSLFYRFASGIICVSAGIKNSIKKIAYLKNSKIHTIYNGLELPNISKYYDNLETDNQKIIFLSIGRLSDDKDYITTLNALSLLKKSGLDFRYIVLGEGPNLISLKKLSNELNIQSEVEFMGHRKDIYKYIIQCDLFIHSSFFEGFSLAILEALSCGKNVVSTDTPHGPAEILANGKYGTLISIGDEKALADAIIHRLNNKIPAKDLISRAKEFSLDDASKRYLELTID